MNQMKELRLRLETVTSQLEKANSNAAFERNVSIRLQELLASGQATPPTSTSIAITTCTVSSAGFSATATSFCASTRNGPCSQCDKEPKFLLHTHAAALA